MGEHSTVLLHPQLEADLRVAAAAIYGRGVNARRRYAVGMWTIAGVETRLQRSEVRILGDVQDRTRRVEMREMEALRAAVRRAWSRDDPEELGDFMRGVK